MPGKRKKDPVTNPSHIVGIGASAGGLEAIESFFKNMPPNNSLAFVVVQHLSPDYKSLMVELLTKKTEMPVLRAEDGMEVKAGSIYLIPPKKNLTIFHGRLLLNDKLISQGINLPIDIFLRSLADDQGERAIAVILSGTGSDGTRGVRAIKEMGGLVMVQSEESARFDGMPRAAMATGLADFVLPPEEMPAQLLAFVAHPYASGTKQPDLLLKETDALTRLFAILREATRVDFTYYKPSTITRRIERRMSVNQIADFEEYVRYLTNFPGEVMHLYRDLLIGVTSFFRDPEVLAELEDQWLPELFGRIAGREIRLWVAGCSTGEEAYTIAIIVKEVMERMDISRDIKIFATDIDRDAIAVASGGVYPDSIAGDLNPRLTTKYFYHKEDKLQVARHLREMVVFAQHNLIRDPPFTNIDFISCRNLLIYLQPVLQRKVFEMFNFSLNPHGLLLLGTSETVGDMGDCFELLNQKHKIYRCRGKVQLLNRDAERSARREGAPPFAYRGRERRREESDANRIITSYLEVASRHYLPLSVIVNQQMEILHVIGRAEGYFTLPSGPADYEITKLAPKDLAIPLATGIQKCFRTGEDITYTNVRLRIGGEDRTIRVRISPLPTLKGRDPLAALFIEELKIHSAPENGGGAAYDLGEEARARIGDLEQELQFARENLQATIEELETSNEELQATNEELLASNEELQSTNEELQSTNEELYTVNAEHQNKIIELTELNNDVDNLLTSCRIGILLLDEELEIRKFSPEINHIFTILDKDIGRPLTHLAHCIKGFDPYAAARRVQQTSRASEHEVQTADNRWYLLRMLPYAIGPNIFAGVVLTFVDITENRAIEHSLIESRTTTREISRHIPIGLFIFQTDDHGDLVLESCNPQALRMSGGSQEQLLDRPLAVLWPEAQAQGITTRLLQVLESGHAFQFEHLAWQDSRFAGTFNMQAFPLPDRRLAVCLEDVSEAERIRGELEAIEARYATLFETMAQGVVYQDRQGRIISSNPAAERILGLNRKALLGMHSDEQHWQAVDEKGRPLPAEKHPSMVALATGEPVFGFVMGVRADDADSYRWILINATPQFQGDDTIPYQVYTTFEDITDRCRLFSSPEGSSCD